MSKEITNSISSESLVLGSQAVLPLPKYNGALAKAPSTEVDPSQQSAPKPDSNSPSSNSAHPSTFETKFDARESLEAILTMTATMSDFVMIVLGFVFANLLLKSGLIFSATSSLSLTDSAISETYLVLAGSLIILCALMGKELYSYRNLMVPGKIWHKFVNPLAFCLFVFTGVSVVARSGIPVPWKFFGVSGIFIFLNICASRIVIGRILRHSLLSARLRRRVVVVGGGPQTMKIQKALGADPGMEFVGWVQAIKPNLVKELDQHRLGSLHDLESILQKKDADIAVLMETESLQREGVRFVARACENEHVQFKMAPHFFEVMVSGVRPETIGGIELLGAHCLPLNGYRNRTVKRIVDIFGAVVGLVLAAPILAVFGALVYWESPGPIFYRQIRQGRNGRLFYIYKLRSMRVNAEGQGKAQWAQKDDHRRLRIGTFMRKWNIDEVPQFWNVLIGHMSLVGPRPERPELIARFKYKVPHYQTRHMYRPGMTGWAQVNGWRGNTDLDERIRHDIWYLENWSLWLDFRIMLETFYRRDNAY